MRATLLLDHEPVAGAHRVTALLKLEGDVSADSRRTPLNLSLVLDRSGSMEGPKLHAARHAAALLVRRLAPEDLISVVAYDDSVTTVAAPATGQAQQDLATRIEAIQTGGSTNLSGGWLRGRELVARGQREGAINRVLLLTDGLAYAGITDPDQLIALCANGNEGGVTTTTIGFGDDFNEQLLSAMADAGGGSTYYIESPDEAASVFAHEIEGLLSLSAQNVTVVLEPAGVVTSMVVQHLYPNEHVGRAIHLQIGDLYAREPRLLLVDFMVSGDQSAIPTAVADIVVRGVVVGADGSLEQREIRLPIKLTIDGAHAEPEIRREVLLLQAAQAREEALRARERGDYVSATRTLRELAVRLSASGLDDSALHEEAADLESMSHVFEAQEVSSADAKYMSQRAYDSQRAERSKLGLLKPRGPGRPAK
jgi:Ca-activated chloride channel family protein